MIAFDDSRTLIPYVYTLYERAPGAALAELRMDQRELPALYAEFGAEVAAIHTRITQVDDPNGWLDKPYFCDPRVEVIKAREALAIEVVTYDWLAKWAEKLGAAVDATSPVRFLHGDLHAGNTMVLRDPLRLSAFIDWGDANWGQAPIDFERVPIWAAPWALASYDAATGVVDETFVGKVLAHVLGKTLEKAYDDEFEPSSQPWHPFPSAFTFNLVRLMGMDLDTRWKPWLPDAPV
jgi:aminoglycoside phosphotransferase (APT) family kinase protein